MFFLLSSLAVSKLTLILFIAGFLYFNLFYKLTVYFSHRALVGNRNKKYTQFITLSFVNVLWSPVFKKNFFLGHFINNVCWR